MGVRPIPRPTVAPIWAGGRSPWLPQGGGSVSIAPVEYVLSEPADFVVRTEEAGDFGLQIVTGIMGVDAPVRPPPTPWHRPERTGPHADCRAGARSCRPLQKGWASPSVHFPPLWFRTGLRGAGS